MSHEVIIIEEGKTDTAVEVYLNHSVPQSIKDKLAAIKSRSGHHISAIDKLKLFLILWRILP